MNTPQIQEVLQKGIRAARRGRKEPARRLLAQAIQGDPNNEEAWLWMSRVVDSGAEKAECLNRVLQINPDNSWAAEQLAALQTAETESAPPSEPDLTQASDIEIEVLQCPNCGSPLELHGKGETKTLVCSSCGSILDLTEEQAAIIGQMDPEVKPALPIELGMEGTFQREAHQVIGWVRYEGWDDEDRWQWDEWLLMSAGGEFRWLSYDNEEGFVFQKKIQPLSPFNPRTATSIEVPGGAAHVTERARAKIVALAGELTWRGKVGDTITYLEAERGVARYSVEYTDQEIELLSGRALSEERVWRAFGRDDLAERAQQMRLESQIQWQAVYLAGAITCLVLLLISCPAFVFTDGLGDRVFRETVSLSPGGGATQTAGPAQSLSRSGGAYRLTLQTEPGSPSISVRASLSNSQNQDYLITTQTLSGGEASSEMFKPTQNGAYSIKLTLDTTDVNAVPVITTLEQGVWQPGYFACFSGLALGLFIILGVMWFRQRSKDKAEANETEADEAVI
jgi:hypothetical protein